MNIIQRIDKYVDEVNNNFDTFRKRVALLENSFFSSDENEMIKLLKIISLCSENQTTKNLNYFYFNKFMSKIKIILNMGNSIIFDNGFFSHIPKDFETEVNILNSNSGEEDFNEFKKNLEKSFFSLSIYCINFYIPDDEEKDLTEGYQIYNKKDFLYHSFGTLLDNITESDGKEIELLKIIKFNNDIRQDKCDEFFNNVQEYINNNELKIIDKITKKEEENFNDIIRAIDILKANELCSEEMLKIYLNFIKIQTDKKMLLLSSMEDFFKISIIGKKFYFKSIIRKLKRSDEKDSVVRESVLLNLRDLSEYNKNDIKSMNKKEKFRISYMYASYSEDMRMLMNFIPKNAEENEIYLKAISNLVFIDNSENIKESENFFHFMSDGELIRYYLNLSSYLKPLPLEKKMEVMNSCKDVLLILEGRSNFFGFKKWKYNLVEKYFNKNKNDRFKYVSNYRKLYSNSFVIEKCITPSINKNINSNYVNVDASDSEKLHIMFTTVVEDISVDEVIQQITEIVEKNLNKDDINHFMEVKFREIELTKILEENNAKGEIRSEKEQVRKKI